MEYLTLSGELSINKELNSITYTITDYEEPISKKILLELKELMGGGFTLNTNAGLELHHIEVVNNTWNEIKIVKN